ncbi:hypothetical protein [Atlantibacter subterraneus]|uniref:hypothetical protein n=1 Tax=Atlantibacter subterraneus TaxID=255519 RepID=UPI00289E4937|nr:hypothetical protein [Atlantibacter subterranea]
MTDNNKHLVRVGHEFAAAMSDDTPIITIAKMVTELASALDVQTARSDALAAKLNDVCAENAAINKFIKDDCWIWDDKSEEYFDAADCMPEPPATDAWVNEQRATGATQVETNLRACYEEFPESSRDIVDECIQIAASTAAQLRGNQV